MALVLVLTLFSCGEKAGGQEPLGSWQKNRQSTSKQISEVSPPASIQELRPILDNYQPQVTIVTPKFDEVLQDNTVELSFKVKELPIFKDSQLGLGPHLHVIIDNQPGIDVYDLSQPLILSDLPPGTHTLRAFANRPWNESFKNEGAYAQTTFHIFTKTDDNNPDAAQPLLTYNSPEGANGAEPILLDFYLTNAPLHLVAKENPQDQIADWRIRCTINGESFILDRWQSIYLKGFKPGKNWVKLEYIDEQGNPVKNVFNSTVRIITYEPKGKDTLARIIRGEILPEQARAIVDPNYKQKIPVAEPTIAPTPKVESTPEIQPSIQPTPTVKPPVEPTPNTQLKEEKPTSEAESQIESPQPEVTPQPEPTNQPETAQSQPEVTPQPEPLPEVAQERKEKRKLSDYFKRRVDNTPSAQKTVSPTPTDKIPTPQETVPPIPSLPPTLPEIIEPPQPETTVQPQPQN